MGNLDAYCFSGSCDFMVELNQQQRCRVNMWFDSAYLIPLGDKKKWWRRFGNENEALCVKVISNIIWTRSVNYYLRMVELQLRRKIYAPYKQTKFRFGKCLAKAEIWHQELKTLFTFVLQIWHFSNLLHHLQSVRTEGKKGGYTKMALQLWSNPDIFFDNTTL